MICSLLCSFDNPSPCLDKFSLIMGQSSQIFKVGKMHYNCDCGPIIVELAGPLPIIIMGPKEIDGLLVPPGTD